eukprot:scaffold444263_cov23-Prasinocladus_malaysianus.AAC.1
MATDGNYSANMLKMFVVVHCEISFKTFVAYPGHINGASCTQSVCYFIYCTIVELGCFSLLAIAKVKCTNAYGIVLLIFKDISSEGHCERLYVNNTPLASASASI